LNANSSKAVAERLPGYDRKTRDRGWAAFVSLGLVGLTTIGFAMSGAIRFAASIDRVVAALSARPMAADATPPLNQCDCPRWCDEFTSQMPANENPWHLALQPLARVEVPDKDESIP
jgi:hypothetical protein